MVRKHRAPNGTLRPGLSIPLLSGMAARQKSSSAIRRMQTSYPPRLHTKYQQPVREHRAPNGALRPVGRVRRVDVGARKHRAPKGALRQESIRAVALNVLLGSECTERHKVHLGAASKLVLNSIVWIRQKAPSTKRCIKTMVCRLTALSFQSVSESTEC